MIDTIHLVLFFWNLLVIAALFKFRKASHDLIQHLEGMVEVFSGRVADLATDEDERRMATEIFRAIRKQRLGRTQ